MYQVYSGPNMEHADFETVEEARAFMETLVAKQPHWNATLIRSSDFQCLYFYNCLDSDGIKVGCPW